jgi:hypothetical protein
MRVSFAVLVALVALAGCADAFGKKDSRMGEPVGVYAIEANADFQSSCVEILNAAPRPWTFEVTLARDGTRGWWSSGPEPIEGTIDGKGALAFKQTIRVPVREVRDKARDLGPCAILRTDEFVGSLAGDPKTEAGIATFTGTLRYAYQIEAGSDCRDVVGVPGPERPSPLFSTLPCDARFATSGRRLRPR